MPTPGGRLSFALISRVQSKPPYVLTLKQILFMSFGQSDAAQRMKNISKIQRLESSLGLMEH